MKQLEETVEIKSFQCYSWLQVDSDFGQSLPRSLPPLLRASWIISCKILSYDSGIVEASPSCNLGTRPPVLVPIARYSLEEEGLAPALVA